MGRGSRLLCRKPRSDRGGSLPDRRLVSVPDSTAYRTALGRALTVDPPSSAPGTVLIDGAGQSRIVADSPRQTQTFAGPARPFRQTIQRTPMAPPATGRHQRTDAGRVIAPPPAMHPHGVKSGAMHSRRAEGRRGHSPGARGSGHCSRIGHPDPHGTEYAKANDPRIARTHCAQCLGVEMHKPDPLLRGRKWPTACGLWDARRLQLRVL
jgi:hypothetical protein